MYGGTFNICSVRPSVLEKQEDVCYEPNYGGNAGESGLLYESHLVPTDVLHEEDGLARAAGPNRNQKRVGSDQLTWGSQCGC